MESKNSKKIIIIAAVALALVAALVVFLILNRPKPEISYDKLVTQINQGEIAEIKIANEIAEIGYFGKAKSENGCYIRASKLIA